MATYCKLTVGQTAHFCVVFGHSGNRYFLAPYIVSSEDYSSANVKAAVSDSSLKCVRVLIAIPCYSADRSGPELHRLRKAASSLSRIMVRAPTFVRWSLPFANQA